MASYPPPTENLPIFNSQSFATPTTSSGGGSNITIPFLDANYLQFPVAQSSLETIPNLAVSVSGTAPTMELGTNTTDIATCAFVIENSVSLDSPAFTGIPTAPTAAVATNTTQLATCEFVLANSGGGGVYAPLDSPVFTGIPEAPTAAVATNTTQLATCEFVLANMGGVGVYAPLDSPVFVGNPEAPTVTPNTDSTTSIATTAFVQSTLLTNVVGVIADPTLWTYIYENDNTPDTNVYVNLETTSYSQYVVVAIARGGNAGTPFLIEDGEWCIGGAGGGGASSSSTVPLLGTIDYNQVFLKFESSKVSVGLALDDNVIRTMATMGSGYDGESAAAGMGGNGGLGGQVIFTDPNYTSSSPVGTDGTNGLVFNDEEVIPPVGGSAALANTYEVTNGTGVSNPALVGNCGTVPQDIAANPLDPTVSSQACVILIPYTIVLGQKYAPLLDPSFIGNPTAPTVYPNTDSTTSLATTAFVQSTLITDSVGEPAPRQLWTFLYENDNTPDTYLYANLDTNLYSQYYVIAIARGGNAGTPFLIEGGEWCIGGAGGGGASSVSSVPLLGTIDYNQVYYYFSNTEVRVGLALNGDQSGAMSIVGSGNDGDPAVAGMGGIGGLGGQPIVTDPAYALFSPSGSAGTDGLVFNNEEVIPPIGGSAVLANNVEVNSGYGVSNPALVGNCGTVPQDIAANPLDPTVATQACVVLIPFTKAKTQKYVSNPNAILTGIPRVQAPIDDFSNDSRIASTYFVNRRLQYYYAPLVSPALTGIPTAPTAAVATNTTQIATCEFVLANMGGVGVYAPLDSPVFTGIPEAPTAAVATNTTQLATCEFVLANLGGYAPLDSPAFTGNPTAPTVTPNTDDTTSLATTAFVQSTLTTYLDPIPIDPVYQPNNGYISIQPEWVKVDVYGWAGGGNAGSCLALDGTDNWTIGGAGGSGGAFYTLNIPILPNYKNIRCSQISGEPLSISMADAEGTYISGTIVGNANYGGNGGSGLIYNQDPPPAGGAGGTAEVFNNIGDAGVSYNGVAGDSGSLHGLFSGTPINPFTPPVSYTNAGLLPPTYTSISNWGQGGRLLANLTGTCNGEQISPDPFLAIPPVGGIVKVVPYVLNPQPKYALNNNTTLTGIPTAPTPLPEDISQQIATTQFVANNFAPRDSPYLSGVPTASNPTAGTNTNQIATTQFVNESIPTVTRQALSGSFSITQTITGDWNFTQATDFIIDTGSASTAITYTPFDSFLKLTANGVYTLNMRVNYISAFNGESRIANNFAIQLYNESDMTTLFPNYTNYSSNQFEVGNPAGNTNNNYYFNFGGLNTGVGSAFPLYLPTGGVFAPNFSYISTTFSVSDIPSSSFGIQLKFGTQTSPTAYTVCGIAFTITYNGDLNVY